MDGLDETIRPLIAALNRVEFIETFSSCGGHPEEAAFEEYDYAVANVVFEIEEEPENAMRWYGMIQNALRQHKNQPRKFDHTCIFSKTYSLNPAGYLAWQWNLKIQATGKTSADCRQGLDEGIAFLVAYFSEVAK